MPKRSSRNQELIRRPPVPEVRASAGRIVDMLQQLVLVRPDMIIPLEEIVSGMLTSFRHRVVTQAWAQQDAQRRPLPPVPLSQLPDMLALLETPTGSGSKPAGRSVDKRKRRR